jgi:tRNA pseudouridine38-40 synthase
VPTYRLTLEYDGTRYRGWQAQKNARSVAGEVRRVLADAVGEILDFGGAGRTDAGVHALAQTAHLRLPRRLDPEKLRREVNGALPPDIHVLSVAPESDRFHSRHSAVSRTYLYQISRRKSAFAKRYVWWVSRPLDTSRILEAAQLAEGRHDFDLFCEKPDDQTSTTVVVDSVEVATDGALILVRLTASHFLRKMVRRLVGILVRVGAGELRRADLESLLRLRALSEEGGGVAEWTAPPSGLFLERVTYPGDPPLPPIRPAFPVREWGQRPESP